MKRCCMVSSTTIIPFLIRLLFQKINRWNWDPQELPEKCQSCELPYQNATHENFHRKSATHENCQKSETAEAAVHCWLVLAANWSAATGFRFFGTTQCDISTHLPLPTRRYHHQSDTTCSHKARLLSSVRNSDRTCLDDFLVKWSWHLLVLRRVLSLARMLCSTTARIYRQNDDLPSFVK